MVYKWKADNASFFRKVDPQEVGERIEQLVAQAGGVVTATAVVADARTNPGGPLHPLFEWNDEEAAHQHRLEQARNVLRSIIVVSTESSEPPQNPIRAFVHLSKGDPSYRPISQVMQTPEMREALVAQAKRELESWERRYAGIVELEGVYREIERLRALEAS